MRSRLASLLLFVLIGVSSMAFAAGATFSHDGRIVAVGDLHGDYDQYLRILKANELIDRKLRWTGGETHFVQLGDVTDRGPDSLKIIEHLMKLEKQAKRAGGQVHVLIGNHEAMNIQADLRYVHPGEYAAIITRRSENNRDRYVEAVFQHLLKTQPELEEQRETTIQQLKAQFPIGYIEHRRLWEPGQKLARWYTAHNAVIQINDTIFLHGGLDPHAETYASLEEINEQVRAALSSPTVQESIVIDERGPLWYRGLAEEPVATLLEPLKRMLRHYGARRIIIAHTPTPGAILTRADGRVILADVGISAHYGSGLANVVIEGDTIYALHRGKLLALPGDAGQQAYLDAVIEIEGTDSRLARYAASLSEPATVTVP